MISGLISLSISVTVAGANLSAQKIAATVPKPAPAVQSPATATKRTITYDITSRGTIHGDLPEFRRIVSETLNDSRGWNRANVTFKEVTTGAMLHIILASGSSVKAASSGCSALLSCRVGSLVLINDDRWQLGSDSYNSLGLPLLSYRQMVINHEVGHYLGHDHITTCENGTNLAPVMLQQSTGLRNCKPSSWPLASELWVKL
jgi:hypothetical protein